MILPSLGKTVIWDIRFSLGIGVPVSRALTYVHIVEESKVSEAIRTRAFPFSQLLDDSLEFHCGDRNIEFACHMFG